MEFHKIVITGGPCGGKTTGLSYIEQGLTKYGYKVIFLNESATEIINSNLNYTAYNDNYLFEKNIIKLQIEKERLYEEACQALPNERVVLICDIFQDWVECICPVCTLQYECQRTHIHSANIV